MTWSDLAVEELDVTTLYGVLALRSAVFVVEQDCVYGDLDGLDLAPGTRHLVARRATAGEFGVAAYARVLAPDAAHAVPRIGRVVVAPDERGQDLGRVLMRRALEVCEERWPGQPVDIGAQAHLADFYGSVGFAPVGEPYDEDGIMHVPMRRPGGGATR